MVEVFQGVDLVGGGNAYSPDAIRPDIGYRPLDVAGAEGDIGVVDAQRFVGGVVDGGR
ncbi:hypothetical protein ES703_123948 [subsurface metagenome]